MLEGFLILIVVVAIFFVARPVFKGIARRKRPERQAVTPLAFHAVAKRHSLHAEDVREKYGVNVDVAFHAKGELDVLYLFFYTQKSAGEGFNERVASVKKSFSGSFPAQKREGDSYTAMDEVKYYEVALVKTSLISVSAPKERMDEAKALVKEFGF